MWETQYMHVMDSHESIFEMIRSTGLKPYLERLGDEKNRYEFIDMVLAGIKRNYPLQRDGRVLFPFKRLFFIAQN